MEDFAVTCPLVPNVPRLRSGSRTSPRAFGMGFLQTPPHDDALALLLAFGSSYTWHRDSHPTRSVPCLARTCVFNGAKPASEAPLAERPVQGMVRRHLHSEARATIAAGVPEGYDNKLFSAHVVVDVVPDP